jgi:hypothetical protein
MSDTTRLKLETRLANQTTNNVLHLILSILTVGIWIPIWILVSANNAIERKRIISKLGE